MMKKLLLLLLIGTTFLTDVQGAENNACLVENKVQNGHNGASWNSWAAGMIQTHRTPIRYGFAATFATLATLNGWASWTCYNAAVAFAHIHCLEHREDGRNCSNPQIQDLTGLAVGNLVVGSLNAAFCAYAGYRAHQLLWNWNTENVKTKDLGTK